MGNSFQFLTGKAEFLPLQSPSSPIGGQRKTLQNYISRKKIFKFFSCLPWEAVCFCIETSDLHKNSPGAEGVSTYH